MLGVGSLDITDDGCDRKRSGLMARDTEIHTVYHTGEKGGGPEIQRYTGENSSWSSLANDEDDDDDDDEY